MVTHSLIARLPASWPRSAVRYPDKASIPVAIPHRSDEGTGILCLEGHAIGEGAERSHIDRFARDGHGDKPSDRLAAPRDFDGLTGLVQGDQGAEMGLRIREIDAFQSGLLTNQMAII